FSDACGAEIPRWIRKQLEAYGDDVASIQAFGEQVVSEMCEKLMAGGAPGLHFYALNQAKPSLATWNNLRLPRCGTVSRRPHVEVPGRARPLYPAPAPFRYSGAAPATADVSMPSPSLRHTLRRLWATDTFVYSLRVFVALAGAMLVGLLEQRLDLVIPLFLGVIASALAETDDNWLGRLQAVAVTLVCFAVAAFSVQLLFLDPWLFVAGLALSTFALTMLGAVGPRYATLGWSTLILAIYTMIGVEQRGGVPGSFWHEPLLLLAGAAWYGALSVLWAALFAHQPVQQGLARLFEELGLYLKIKSSLLEP